MTTFLHTADWHLGMTRRFLSSEAQARYADARIQAVRDLAGIARDEECAFVVACGDLFDSNHVDRQIVARALEAMAAFTVPVLLLPGNHDPLDAGSVYRSRMFLERKPAAVTVIEGTDPIAVVPGIEVVGAPWTTRRPGADLVAAALTGLAPPPSGTTRVLVAHGVVDVLSPDPDDPGLIVTASLRAALDAGVASYVALGDRHSCTVVVDDPRVRYPGSPVATDHREVDSGSALVVRLGDGSVDARSVPVGHWAFVRRDVLLNGDESIEHLGTDLAVIPDKQRTIVRLALAGTLRMGEDARLHQMLAEYEDLFASLTVSERSSRVVVVGDESELHDLGLSGYANAAVAEINALSVAEGPQQRAAQDALRIVYRLVGSRT
ncbi:MAG: exonuclease SbcCD subunit D [Thermoleophilia bacterium]|nr:exonuclease SbcCD subunit D [Thermoleophilia bacterium]